MKDKDGDQDGFQRKWGERESNDGDSVWYEEMKAQGNINITLCGSVM